MGASAVTICSNALLRLGDAPINSFDENSDRARLAANLYPPIRDAVLRSHFWNCAVKRVQLAPDSTKPPFGFSNRFLLPSDCLRVKGLHGLTDFQLEGRYILANRNLLSLIYVARVSESIWDAMLVEAVTLCMRQAFAYAITESASLEDLVSTVLRDYLKKVRAVDGQENPPETLGEERLWQAGF